ncbi:hypothetical protein FHT82_003450 [Rhizobium sp. BK275]|nr:hypothetical protein [Rhizobium sp. BK275]MBB3406541.1 hypothetical protein [Rhizobium sp. BK316]
MLGSAKYSYLLMEGPSPASGCLRRLAELIHLQGAGFEVDQAMEMDAIYAR